MHMTTSMDGIFCWTCPVCVERRQLEKRARDIIYTSSNAKEIKLSPVHHKTSSSPRSVPGGGLIVAENGLSVQLSSHSRCRSAKSIDEMCYLCQRNRNSRTNSPVGSCGGGSPNAFLFSMTIPPGLEPEIMCPSELSENAVVPVDTDDDEVQNLYMDGYLQNNRLEHMVQVMGYHPRYLKSFLKTQQYMLRGDGPLSYDVRHYIAIMAAARHQCSYLVNIHVNEFLAQGGNERWLKGLEHIPKKLRDLNEINKILAHRPWLINKSHIEKLTRGEDNWSISEVMHAVVLLSHFHALASFTYGCGINPEIDHSGGHAPRSSRPPSIHDGGGNADLPGGTPGSQHSTPGSGDVEGGIEVLMERMRKLTEEAQEEMTQEELQKRFECVESISAELPAATAKPSPKADILCFIDDSEFTYQDFAKRGNSSDIPTFRAQDYSWEDQGYSLANRLYAEIGSLLDDKFQIAYDLTYFTMGDIEDVDTSSFRRSIWHYIHCMFGIRHDDYDYSEVNQLLERSLKAYIKTVTCFPERVTKRDYDSFMREFKQSEKVHVNLMLLEARCQAELLYSLRAIMRYMT